MTDNVEPEVVETAEAPAAEAPAAEAPAAEVEAPAAEAEVPAEEPAAEVPAAEVPAAEAEAPAEPVVEAAPVAVRAPRPGDRPIQTVGRRKEAVVRVRLTPGTGKFILDGRSLEEYFPNKVHQQLIKAPLVLVDRLDTVDIFAHLDGGGPSGQAGALRLAIARALIIVQPEDRPPLKKAGFLTRDPRAIERKKYGLKKARKAPQYSKR